MRIAITGGSGALGNQLLRTFVAHGHDVLILGRSQISLAEMPLNIQRRISFSYVDLLSDFDICNLLKDKKVTHLIHCAWVTRHPAYWWDIENASWQRASLRLHEQFCEAGGEYFSFIGSCAEYAWKSSFLNEDQDREVPETYYGLSKLATTTALKKQTQDYGVGFMAARIFFPFGVAENAKRVTSLATDALLANKPFHLNDGDVYRDIYSSRFASEAIAELLRKNVTGIINIASGRPTHLGEFIKNTIGLHTGRSELVTWTERQPSNNNIRQSPLMLVGSAIKLETHFKRAPWEDNDIEDLIRSRRAYLSING